MHAQAPVLSTVRIDADGVLLDTELACVAAGRIDWKKVETFIGRLVDGRP